MYNPAFEDDLCKDRNQSFRKALRVPRKIQRDLTNITNAVNDPSTGENTDKEPRVEYFNEKVHKPAKYNWKHFLPWARKSKG